MIDGIKGEESTGTSDGIKGEANTGTRDPNLITEDIPIVPRKGLNISITIEVMGGIIITKDDGSPRLSRWHPFLCVYSLNRTFPQYPLGVYNPGGNRKAIPIQVFPA